VQSFAERLAILRSNRAGGLFLRITALFRMFAKTLEVFDRYYRTADEKKLPGFNRDLGCEVRERLEQLDYIVKKVRELEAAERAAVSRSQQAFKAHIESVVKRGIPFESVPAPPEAQMTREEVQAMQRAHFEMKLLTESFYYFAGRIRTIIKNRRAPLPGLASFECNGVRDVRNKLVEHPEGNDSQVSTQSFGSGGPNGPVLKAIRNVGQEKVFPDRGLYANAKEFRENLEKVLQAKLSEF
jgi:hypothetical protein